MRKLIMTVTAVLMFAGCLVPAKVAVIEDYEATKHSIYVAGDNVLAAMIKDALEAKGVKLNTNAKADHVLNVKAESKGTALALNGVGESYSFYISLVDKKTDKKLFTFSGHELESHIIKEICETIAD